MASLQQDEPDEPAGVPGGQAKIDIHKPFTLSERFEQLNAIDEDIIKLLALTNDALRPLATPLAAHGADPSTAPKDYSAPEAIHTDVHVSVYRDALNGFLATLHSVDVRLKRQIWMLEEDGIITLKEGKATGSALEPNGVGDIGSLDVGYLNSRSSKVDRDMETLQWQKLRASMEEFGFKTEQGQSGV